MLVGLERIRAVRTVLDAFDRAVSVGRVEIIVVEAPTGWGKTALLQAFYQQLAMRQPRPQYWPMSLPDNDRKAVYPPYFQPRTGARMPYFWWGLAGRQVPGKREPEPAALAADPQLDQHLAGLVAAVLDADKLWQQRVRLAVKAVEILPSLGLFGGILDKIDKIQNQIRTAQDIADVIDSATKVFKSRDALISAALSRQGERTIDVRADTAAMRRAKNAGRALGTVAHLLPFVVVVDDAQFLDQATARLLQEIGRHGEAAGLIVMTSTAAQPGEPGGSPLASWISEQESHRLPVTTIALPRLADADMGQLAATWSGPLQDPEVLGRVIERADGNPLTLAHMLELPLVRKALAERDPDMLSPLARLPISDLEHQLAWEALPEPARRVLSVASIHGHLSYEPWLMASMPDTDASRAEAALADCCDRGWLYRPFPESIQFTDTALQQVAANSRDGVLSPDEQRRVAATLYDQVTEARTDGSWQQLPLIVRESSLTAVLDDSLHPVPDGEARAAMSVELATVQRVTGRPEAARALVERLRTFEQTGSVMGAVVATSAEVLFDLGQADEALALLQAEHARLAGEVGENDLATLAALHNLAAVHAAAKRFPEAIDLYRQLLDRRLSVLPPAHEYIRATRRDLAQVLTECHQLDQAIDVYEELYDDNLETVGQSNRQCLADSLSLYRCLRSVGRPDEAAAELAALRQTAYQALGPREILTLAIDQDYAGALGDLGHPDLAVEVMTPVVAMLTELVGLDGPSVLIARDNLAKWTGRAGRPAGAAHMVESLLPDFVRILGPDEFDTLICRQNLGYYLQQGGRLAEAEQVLEQVVQDFTRVFGPDNPLCLVARGNLAICVSAAGRPADAVHMLADLLADRQRVLGPDNPSTLLTRHNLGNTVGEAGDAAGAAYMLKELVQDEVRVLGPLHPNTLLSRKNYATWLSEVGHPAEAIGLLREILPDVVRAFGPQHPQSVQLATALRQLQERHTQERDLAEAQRSLGQEIASGDHDKAPAAMYHLAWIELQAGHVDEARHWYREAIDTGHPDIAAPAMNNLGHLERQQGNLDEARPWLTQAIVSGHPDAAPRAMDNLAILEKQQGNFDQARRWYSEAIATGHPEAAPRAMLNRGILEEQQGNLDEARHWWESAMDAGHYETAERAKRRLRDLDRHEVG